MLAWFVCMCSSYSCCCRTLACPGSDEGQRVECGVRPLLPSTDSPRQWRGHEREAGRLYQCMTACFSSLCVHMVWLVRVPFSTALETGWRDGRPRATRLHPPFFHASRHSPHPPTPTLPGHIYYPTPQSATMADKGPVTIRSRKFIRNALLARRQMVSVHWPRPSPPLLPSSLLPCHAFVRREYNHSRLSAPPLTYHRSLTCSTPAVPTCPRRSCKRSSQG